MRIAMVIDEARAMWGRLARRERLLVFVAFGALLGLVALITVLKVNQAIEDRISRIAYKEDGLARVIDMSSGFREAQEEQQRLESLLRGQEDLSLFSYLEEIARGQEISIANMTPRQPVTEGNIREETVEVSLESVTLDKVAALVNAVQRSPHMIRISSMRVRRRGSADEVQASFTVSSYALAGTG